MPNKALLILLRYLKKLAFSRWNLLFCIILPVVLLIFSLILFSPLSRAGFPPFLSKFVILSLLLPAIASGFLVFGRKVLKKADKSREPTGGWASPLAEISAGVFFVIFVGLLLLLIFYSFFPPSSLTLYISAVVLTAFPLVLLFNLVAMLAKSEMQFRAITWILFICLAMSSPAFRWGDALPPPANGVYYLNPLTYGVNIVMASFGMLPEIGLMQGISLLVIFALTLFALTGIYKKRKKSY